MIKVSVIVPIFNREDCLKRCIDSLTAQSLKEIEIILVDDGSSDNSVNICKQYIEQDNRIKLVQQSNSGVSSARNKGLGLVEGEYVAFCDSDDWIDPDAYFNAYNAAIKNNSDLVVFGFYNEIYNYKEHVTIENKFTKVLTFNGNEEIGRAIIALEKKYFFEAPWNKLFKFQVIKQKKIGFDPAISMHEDFLFNLNFSKNISSCVILDQAFYHIVGRDRQSLSKQIVHNPLESIFENVNQKRGIMTEFGLSDPDFDLFLDKKLISALSGVLPSIYRKGSMLSRKERLSIIKTILRELKGKSMDTTTFQGKVSAALFKTNSPSFIDLGNSILSKVRYIAPSLYIKVRNFFNSSHIKQLQEGI